MDAVEGGGGVCETGDVEGGDEEGESGVGIGREEGKGKGEGEGL